MEVTFKPVPQSRLEVSSRTERHKFSQQMRLPCDSNWVANSVKPLKGTPLPVEPTLCWYFFFVTDITIRFYIKSMNHNLDFQPTLIFEKYVLYLHFIKERTVSTQFVL